MDYKDTLLMPKTDFQMKGNLPEKEKIFRDEWYKMDLYNKLVEQNKDGKLFVLHDGPPYANGNIHLGHAFNKILKDFINRYKIMNGYKTIYIPGFDTHGLPIETAITKTGVDRKTISKLEFRKLCRKYAEEQVRKQTEDFKNLNVLADWSYPYITYQKEFEAKQIEVFAKMAQKGLIFKGLKPIYWSPSSESALAEAEIEYKDRKDPSIFVAFPVETGNSLVEKGDNLVIWTTTPWTLPGNLGIAVGEFFQYVKVLVNNKKYIVAEDLLDSLAQDFAWENYEVISTFKGKEIEGIKYKHVFMNRISPVVVGYHVTLESGTGLVHIAPSYGEDDFNIGKQFNLGMVNGINDNGVLNEESGEFKGLFFEDANKEVTKKLDQLGVLLKLKFITHSYPHDWRTKKPVIFRATDQWFCSIEKIKQELLNEINNDIKWYPEWGKLRLNNMIKERNDWCISRQRAWGVPLPIFYNEDGSEILDYDVMMHVAQLFRQYGSDVWYEKTAKELLPTGYTNLKSPNGNFTKEEDIMDVWFDSGSSHTAVLLERGLKYPADVYLEGSDQYRGWFNSSLICGVAVHGKSPYKTLISHGFIVDEQGRKMSKSLGNGVDPNKFIRLNGAEILRWWVASVDYTEDVKIFDALINQVKESYRKLRNTYKFMLGNLFDFEYEKNKVAYEDLKPYDQYILIKLNDFVKECKNCYDEFKFQEIYKLVNNFITFTLSSFYLDFTKDILYVEEEDSLLRRSTQTVLYEVTKNLALVLAPLLPHTSEEVYKNLNGKLASVQMEKFSFINSYSNENKVKEVWDNFFKIKDDVYKALEEARNDKLIGKGLEAKVLLNLNNNLKEKISFIIPILNKLLIVSKVELVEDKLSQYNNCGVKVLKFEGIKCERCWNYFEGQEMHDDLCDRCHNIIENTK